MHEQSGETRHARGGDEHCVAHPVRARPHAEERRGQDVEAIRRAQRLGLDQQPVEDHGQRERQQAEEDAAIAREQEAEDQRSDGREHAADQHLDEDVGNPEEFAERARRVRTQAIEERLAEGD